MIHPFLILPAVGAFMLVKILVSNASKSGYQRGTIGMALLLLVILAALWYFISDDMRPTVLWHHYIPVPRPERNRGRPEQRRVAWDFGGLLERMRINEADDAVLIVDVLDGMVAPAPEMIPVHDGTDVHNHQIQSSLRESLKRLKTWYLTINDPLSASSTYEQIKTHIFQHSDDTVEKKERAYNVLRHMEKHDGTLHSVGLSETAILQMVWQRIISPVNDAVKDELKNSLIELLSDSSIHLDRPYCLVGRITRMVQSLQMLDEEGLVSIKNLQTIHAELQTKIPLLVDEYFKHNPEQQQCYNEGDETAGIRLQQYVLEKLKNDYPNSAQDSKLQQAIISHTDELF